MQHIVHRISITTAALFLLLQTAVPLLYSADFYIDPVSGSPDGDGSLAQPWKSLQEVIDSNRVESMKWSSLPYDGTNQLVIRNEDAPIKGGDTIWLFDGDYESVNITGYYNTQTITLAAMDGATPRFSSILIRAGANWHLRGLSVSPSYATVYEPVAMIDLDSHGYHGPVRDITVENCSLQSVPDVSGWSLEDWNQLATSGIAADGTTIIIRNNRLRNVNFGISVTASHSLVQSNVIENFSGDGLRGLGNYTTFDSNTVKNCYDVNANHDDGFQSWSYNDGQVGAGEVIGIILRNNLFINYEDANQPFRGTLQGIGCFDGTFVDWVVENNVVYTDHYHGITLLGARNCRIVNNTVLDPNNETPGPPWINIGNHKNGTEPVDCLVRNNLTTKILSANGVTYDNNIIMEEPEAFIMDPTNFDFRLRPESAAIDKGSRENAPLQDFNNQTRPVGAAIDIGAHEFQQ